MMTSFVSKCLAILPNLMDVSLEDNQLGEGTAAALERWIGSRVATQLARLCNFLDLMSLLGL